MLKFQRLDRRMSGYRYFKYRVEFPYHSANYTNEEFTSTFEAGKVRIRVWIEALEYLNKLYGYGPEVDKVYYYQEFREKIPAYAVRYPVRGMNSSHIETIYFRGDEERNEFEKFLLMLELKK